MQLSRSFVYGSMITLALTGCPGDDSTNDTGGGTTNSLPETTTGEPETITTTGEPETTTNVDTTTGEPGTTTTGEPETTTNVDTGTTGSAGVDFEMMLTGYPHNDMYVTLAIVEAGTMNVVGEIGDIIAGMELVLSSPGALMDGTSYDIYWYVDVNENVVCDAPPADHSWEMLGQVAGPTGLSLSHVHDANWVDVCANF